MLALSYNEYGQWCCICAEACIHVQIYLVTQGGDWGHMVRSNQLLNENSQSNLYSHRLHERQLENTVISIAWHDIPTVLCEYAFFIHRS